MRRLPILAAIAGVVATLPARVDAVVCVTERHALVVRDACRSEETPADLAALGVVGPKGDAGSAGASLPRVRAFDAGGAFVGYVGADGSVFMQAGDRVLFVRAGTDGFRPFGTLRFEAPSCTGPALVAGPGVLTDHVPVHGTTAYYAGDPIETRPIQSTLFVTTAQSCLGVGGTYDVTAGLCCSPSAASIQTGPATSVDLGGFSPPFHLEIDR